MKNLKTTISGGLAAIGIAIMPFLQGAESNLQELIGLLTAISLAIKSWYSKDKE